jgi:hypothetical protein
MTTRNDGASESSYAVIFPRRICPLLQMRRRRTMTDMEDNVLPPSVAMRMPLLRHSLLVQKYHPSMSVSLLGGPAQDLSKFQTTPIPILSVLTCSTS